MLYFTNITNVITITACANFRWKVFGVIQWFRRVTCNGQEIRDYDKVFHPDSHSRRSSSKLLANIWCSSNMALKAHPKTIINALVGEGITNIQEVKQALRHHVMHILFPDTSNHPSDTNWAYTLSNQHGYQEPHLHSKVCIHSNNCVKTRSRQFEAQNRPMETQSSSSCTVLVYTDLTKRYEDHSVSDAWVPRHIFTYPVI